MEDWRKLDEVPSIKMWHSDHWGFKITCLEDNVEIRYFEMQDGKEKYNDDEFNIPTFCAKQVAEAIIKLVDLREEN